MFVLKCLGPDPMGDYKFINFILPGTAAIDETVLIREDNSKFLVWSQFTAVGQCIYIGDLVNPWTVGNKVKLSCPDRDWEKRGWNVNEGPAILKRNKKTFIVYSGSGCSTEDYCLGMLTNTDGNYLNPGSWSKSPQPIF
jgi:GH43 family beta-xylosidase